MYSLNEVIKIMLITRVLAVYDHYIQQILQTMRCMSTTTEHEIIFDSQIMNCRHKTGLILLNQVYLGGKSSFLLKLLIIPSLCSISGD